MIRQCEARVGVWVRLGGAPFPLGEWGRVAGCVHPMYTLEELDTTATGAAGRRRAGRGTGSKWWAGAGRWEAREGVWVSFQVWREAQGVCGAER